LLQANANSLGCAKSSKSSNRRLTSIRKAHRDTHNSAYDFRFARVRKAPHLTPGIRMRNRRQVTAAHFAQTTNVRAAKFGEIRGSEAFDLLQLLNTGHAGTLSTIHASSAKQGLARFTSCVLQSGIELPYRSSSPNR
jgi:hypothetical protein